MTADEVPGREAGWPDGLAEEEAARRAARGDANVVRDTGSVPLARILRRNVFTVLNGVLFGVSLILLLLGLVVDALVTAGPVALNVAVAVVQEVDAKRKLERLTLITRPKVALRREGRDLVVRPDQVVRGDVVVLERGDQAVVDGTVVAGAFEADESVLSGESEPVTKRLGDEVLSGSACLSGRAAVEVTRIGDETFGSRIVAEARRTSDERTPLRRDLDVMIVQVGLVTAAASVPVGLAMRAAGEAFLSVEAVQAAAVLVALVPQGLAVMATVTYALAAVRISRAGAIVQRIDAVESMSRVDTLCLDKTGTLTTQGLVLDRVVPLDRSARHVERLLGAMAAATASGNRTTDAIAAALPGDGSTAVDEVAFSSERRWSAVTLASSRWPLLLGAPEVLDDGSDGRVATEVAALAEQGRRVLLFCEAIDGPAQPDADGHPPPARPLAVVALREALRPDAAETLGRLRQAGLDLKVVSGDNPTTVAALAESVGLTGGGQLSGREVASMDDLELAARAPGTRVFGRIEPDDKRRLVVALRADGRYVGMTGDGVNDVPALRRANLGIAMESGTSAARAVAGLVLLGNRFEVLPRAIVEGQRVVSSMIAVATVLLSRTVYMLLIVLAGALLGLPFPFTPRNNAVLALVTVGIPTILLTLWVQPAPAPRSVTGRIWRYALPSGVAVALLAVPVLLSAFDGVPVGVGRSTMTTLTVFTGIALIPILFPPVAERAGPAGRGGDIRPTLLAVAMLALFGLIASVPLGREFFELTLLPLDVVARLLAYTLVWMTAIIGLLRLDVPGRLVRLLATRRG